MNRIHVLNVCHSGNKHNNSYNTNLGHSRIDTDIVQTNFDRSTRTTNLQSEERYKGGKSKIPRRIDSMSQENVDSLKQRNTSMIFSGSIKDQMDYINNRFERIEKALFSNID